MKSIRAADLTGPALSEKLEQGTPIVLSIGSFEQHGDHLPMGTDFMIAQALADAVAERVDGLALPCLPYGAMSRPRPGGGGDLFRHPDLGAVPLFEAVKSLCRGCFEGGVELLIVLSWHLENGGVVWDAVREATPAQGGQALLADSPWKFMSAEAIASLSHGSAEAIDWDADHAGLLETALALHLFPELVGEIPEPKSPPLPPYDILPTPPQAAPIGGVRNDARKVTAESGKDAFDQMVDGLADAVAATRRGEGLS